MESKKYVGQVKQTNNVMTDIYGHPIPDNQNSLTAGTRGPILIQDYHLINKLAHFDRERIPERVVHAKGAGAHGYFEVTHDITRLSKAKFLNRIGKRTPIFARFSTVGGERGSADTARDPRGFAVKFYTEDGNWDFVGNNTPVFFIKDPMKFPDFIHTQKRDPQTNLKSPDMFWDFISLSPETTHQVCFLFGDRGTPYGYRNMHGFSGHTLKLVNSSGGAVWVKMHFKSKEIKNLSAKEAKELEGKDPDWATRDLFNHLQKGGTTEWTCNLQVMTLLEAERYRFDPFDVTKVWSQKDFPLIPFGKLVLNKNPENFFAEVEQAAFTPGNLVPGIEASPDKMLQGRIFSYADTHRYRLGVNYTQIPVNAPLKGNLKVYVRDGLMQVNGNGGSAVNYEPNSFGGPVEDKSLREHALPISGTIIRSPYTHSNNNYEQAGNFYTIALDAEGRTNLVNNLVDSLKYARKEIQVKQVQHFLKANNEFGTRVSKGLGLSLKKD